MRIAIIILFLLPTFACAQDGWYLRTGGGDWTKRAEHLTVELNGELLVWNGTDGSTLSDLWKWNGLGWGLATNSLPFGNRRGASAVAFNGRVWMIGGNFGNLYMHSTVWSSDDGVNWTQDQPAAPWTPREHHTSVVFNGRMWILGGWTKQNNVFYNLGDVWSSDDGVNWTQEAAPPWSARSLHSSVVFDNRMWVFGGVDDVDFKNDVWSTVDGVNWVEETSAAAWIPRRYHATAVHHDRIWLTGGDDFVDIYADVWSSTDGVNWELETSDAPWARRSAHTSFSFEGRLWILGGGGDNQLRDDAWTFGLHILQSSLPEGTIDKPYTAVLEADARLGMMPFAWVHVGGALPPGLSLGASTTETITIEGIPEHAGSYTFTIFVQESMAGDGEVRDFSIKINPKPPLQAGNGDSGCSLARAGPVPVLALLALLAALGAVVVGLRLRVA